MTWFICKKCPLAANYKKTEAKTCYECGGPVVKCPLTTAS